MVKADQTGSPCNIQNLHSALIAAEWERVLHPKTQSKRGIDQKEIKSEQRGIGQRAGSDRQHRDRAVM